MAHPYYLSLEGETIQPVSLKDIEFSLSSIANVPAEDQKDNRGRSLRESVISDLNYENGSVMLSGISNQEFSSTFRVIPFPFTDKQQQSSLEIYHAAHGKYETNSPIRTFTTATLNGKKYLVASYTCTPLVLFPMDELQPGKHVKGRTVGEFGAGNSPIDMITVKKGDNSYLVMANSSRPVMRVNYKKIATYEGSLTEPMKESFSTAGVDFVTLPVVSVLQMDKLDDTKVLVLQRKSNGDLDLSTLNDRIVFINNLIVNNNRKTGFCILWSLVFYFLFTGCTEKKDPDSVSIQWEGDKAVAIIVPQQFLSSVPKDSVKELLHIRLANADQPVIGDYSFKDDDVII